MKHSFNISIYYTIRVLIRDEIKSQHVTWCLSKSWL